MRIFGRICGWVAATMLVLQAICVFYGYPLHGNAGGVELITLAAWCATDAIVYFKKPKNPYLRVKFRRDDGAVDEFVVRADHTTTFSESLQKPFHALDIVFFESDKNEVANEQKN